MQLPSDFLQSLEGLPGYDQQAFWEVHQGGSQLTSIRFNPAKKKWSTAAEMTALHPSFSGSSPVPWAAEGYYLQQRPSFTFDPLFHAGLYYVQEASSMFLEQAVRQHVDTSQQLHVLDLSAAPGGKTTHLQSLISEDSLLVANEVIRNRALILMDNIMRWGAGNVVISNNDPAAFKKLEGFFDLVVVDAPCSGSGMFRKDPDAIGEWSLNNVALCSQRQQRILADILPALRPGGILIYSTCSYSADENENIGKWLAEEFGMESLEVMTDASWGIITSRENGCTGYRFYPDKVKGEGFFLACFRKTSGKEGKHKPGKIERAGTKDAGVALKWLNRDSRVIREASGLYAMDEAILTKYAMVKPALNIIYQGTGLGEVMKERLVPGHSLALSPLLSESIPRAELDLENAVKYLQRQEFSVKTGGTGWHTVHFKGYNLGWINVLQNRINNYYPKELRILKQHID